MAEYETYFGTDLREDEEFETELIDKGTKEIFRARICAARSEQSLPGSSPLWVRDRLRENTAPYDLWYVRILSRVDDETEEVKRAEVPLEERKGYMLRSLLEERLVRDKDAPDGGEAP